MTDSSNIAGYMAAYVTVKILELCGDELTRENLLKHATNLTNLGRSAAAAGHHHHDDAHQVHAVQADADSAFRRHHLGA